MSPPPRPDAAADPATATGVVAGSGTESESSARAAAPERAFPAAHPAAAPWRRGSDGLQLRTRLALYAAAATLLWLVERTLPNPVPWIRLGLANAVTLLVLLEHGSLAAGIVLVLRLLLAGIFAGTLLGPQALLALGGGVASWATMTLALRWGGGLLSPLGLSVLGASAHAAAQLALVGAVLGAGAGAWELLPLFAIVALLSGACTGIIVDVLQARMALARGARPLDPPLELG